MLSLVVVWWAGCLDRRVGRQRFRLVGGGAAAGNVDVVADAPAVSVWLSTHVAGG
jgi:hypothetical protein